MRYGKMAEIEGEHRVRVCNELFMSSSVWCAVGLVFYCVHVCAEVLNECYCCFKDK